jgi:DNA primase
MHIVFTSRVVVMSYLINDEIIERVRSSSDIVDIISQYINLKRTGSNYVGLCPFHSEKTPSFSVSPTKQFYHCFGCGESGDVISFIMKEENLSFPEAVKFLADKLGIIIDEKENEKNVELMKEKKLLYNINRETARFFYYSLKSNAAALSYLKKRAVSEKTIKVYGLGFADGRWDSLLNYLVKKGFEEKDLEMAGLIIKKKGKNGYYDRFRNRIIFPIVDTRGNVIAFGGRSIDSSNPKYLNSPETIVFSKRNNLYGLNILNRKSDRKKVVLVEGYMDVVSLYNSGIDYAVASLGTAFTPEQGKMLVRYKDEIYICYDSDTAGINAANRALDLLKEEGINAKVLVLPMNYDPDDFIKKYGREKFENLFQNSLNYIDFKIYFYKNRYDLNNPSEKIMFTRDMGKFLKGIKSPVERDVYLDKIAKETGISSEAIKSEYKMIPKDKYINANYRNNKDKIIPVKNVLEPAHLKAEKTIIYLISKDKRKFFKIKNRLNSEDFMNFECRELAKFIFDFYEENENMNIDSIYDHFDGRDDVDSEKIKEILNMDINIEEGEIDKVIEDLLETIFYSKLKMKRKEISKEINEIDKKPDKTERDVEKFKQLCLQILEIDRELNLHQ